MINHDEAFDLKFAPEYGQADEGVGEEVGKPEDTQDTVPQITPEEDADEYDDDDEYDEDDDYSDEDIEVEIEPEPAVPLSRYNELRKTFTQKSMELADLKKSMVPAKPQEAPPQSKPKGELATSLDAMLEAKVNAKLEQYLAPIREQEEDLQLQSEIIALAESDPEFGNVSALFLKQLEASPQLFGIENGIGIAYKAAKAEYLEKVSATRVKVQTEAAVQRRQMKENITDGSSYTRPSQSKARTEADFIRDSIMELGVRKTF